MGTDEEACFDVYLRTRVAVVTVVREVTFSAAQLVARRHAKSSGKAMYIRDGRTRHVVLTVEPPSR